MILPQDPAPGKSNYQWVTGPIVELVEHVQCKGKAHLVKMLKEIEENGGEGFSPVSFWVSFLKRLTNGTQVDAERAKESLHTEKEQHLAQG